MVYVVDDLDFFKECAAASSDKLFRIWMTSKGFLVKLRADGVGFSKEFGKKDGELNRVKELIEIEGFVRVTGVESDNDFFAD